MTEEEVVNVRGEEISENGNDHLKIKAEHCNGDVHEKQKDENGNVGGEVDGEIVAAVSGSSASDPIVTVDANVSEDRKVDGESRVKVTEANDCGVVSNGSAEGTCETTTADVVEREEESGIVDSQNGSGSGVVVAEGGEELRIVQNGVSDKEVEGVTVRDHELESVQNGVSDKEVEGVTVRDHQLESVQNGVSDKEVEGVSVQHHELESVQNGVVHDVDVSKDVAAADVDKSDRELEGSAVENGTAVDSAEEIEIPVVVELVTASTDEVECTESDVVVLDKDHESVERENNVGEDVSHIESNGINELELKSVGDVEAVDADKVSDATDVKECAGESVENGLEEVEVSESTEENKVLVDGELGGELEKSGEESVVEVVPEGDMVVDVAVVSESEPSTDTSSVVENEAEPSEVAVQGGADSSVDMPDLKTDAVESEAKHGVETEVEPSNNVVKGETEPSVSAVKGEADSSVDMSDLKTDVVETEGENEIVRETEPLINVVEREAEPLNNIVEREAEPLNNIVEREAEPLNNVVEREAEPSNNVVESEAEPSDNAVQAEAVSSVDVPDLKTDAVESKSEPLVEAAEPSAEGSSQADGDSRPTQEGSAADALEAESMVTEVVKRPFYYLIRVPRYDDDENMKDKIKNALQQVDEKTKLRDAFRGETQTKKAICKEYSQAFRDAAAEERAARDLLKSKRQEMDSVQSTMNRLNNVISVGDIDGKIRNMEHMIQHETLPLKEEKQLIRQIKQLKQSREELSANIGKDDQSRSLDNIEEHSKQFQLLRKELEVLRNNVSKTETVTKAARKKYEEECNQLSELMARFKAADDTRQEAYIKLQTLKRQLHEKSKYFWEYKNAATKAHELAAHGKKEELQSFCIEQDERIRELWNNNDEFRRNYIRCNTRSTLRRLQTHDGRSLGPDEEPPVIPAAFNGRVFKNDSLVSRSSPEQEKKSTSAEPASIKAEPVSKVVVQKTEESETAKVKKPAKPAPLKKSAVAVSRRWGDESDEETREEPVRTKEEEERILKAEKARKEEEAEKLKEMRRLEEIEKAKEALQRKKRNAEKAQQRAAYKAQKEAEQKEKERERRARKKDKRKATPTDEAADITEQDSAPSTEILTRATEELDQSEKPAEVTKRVQKPSQFIKQNKVKSLPMAIRNRGRRRMQPWMWVLIAVLVVVVLFYMGNNSFLRSSLQSFGF